MHRLKIAIRNIRLKKKLLISYSLVVFIPVAMIGYFFISNVTRESIRQSRSANQSSFSQMKSNFDSFFLKYTQLSDNMKYDPTLTEYLKKVYPDDVDTAHRYFDYYVVSSTYEQRLAYQRIDGVSIEVYTSNSRIHTDSNFIFPMDASDRQSSWYMQAVGNSEVSHIGVPAADSGGNYSIPMVTSLTPDSLFSNILRVNIPESLLYQLMEKENPSNSVYVVNSGGVVVSSTERGCIGKGLSTVAKMKDVAPQLSRVSNTLTVSNRKDTCFIGRIGGRTALDRCWIVMDASSRPLVAQLYEITGLSLLVCLLIVIADIALIFLFSNGITTRIQTLIRAMSKVKDGRFDITVDCEGRDEIALLASSFRQMLDRTETLIDEVYTSQLQIKNSELRAREAEIHALQSQINPHFLFNSLESIKTNVLKNHDMETADIIVSFSRLIRKSIDWKSDLIPLRNEMELAEDYLKIQKLRYRHRLEYRIDEDHRYDCLLIPKFTLQPIVENAVVHGIESRKEGGRVRIAVRSQSGAVRIIIADNGGGIDQGTLARLREKLAQPDIAPAGGKIGLLNVQQRLRMYFGAGYGLTIRSEGNGTAVTVSLPLSAPCQPPSNEKTAPP